MKKLALYGHGGSANHGCEALVRTITSAVGSRPVLFTQSLQEDEKYGINNICDIVQERKSSTNIIDKISLKLKIKSDKSIISHNLIKWRGKAISIGGDVYCYDIDREQLNFINKQLRKNGCKTALVGCSIEPELLKEQSMLADLQKYDLITARESITYNALVSAGITKNTFLIPDSAFLLEAEKTKLPDGFMTDKMVGINISPLILNYGNADLILKNYVNLVKFILEKTDYSIAFVPHVVVNNNDDRSIIAKLLSHFDNKDRLVVVDDMSATNLKYVISKCNLFIGARTHATIAAYSSCVPTLVVGYSIKSIGIARDLFGSEKGRVISVKDLASEQELANEFAKMLANEKVLREELKEKVAEYIKQATQIKSVLQAFIN